MVWSEEATEIVIFGQRKKHFMNWNKARVEADYTHVCLWPLFTCVEQLGAGFTLP